MLLFIARGIALFFFTCIRIGRRFEEVVTTPRWLLATIVYGGYNIIARRGALNFSKGISFDDIRFAIVVQILQP